MMLQTQAKGFGVFRNPLGGDLYKRTAGEGDIFVALLGIFGQTPAFGAIWML